MFSKSQKTESSSAFSEFIRNASSGEKKKVYRQVIDSATKAQASVIAKAELVSSHS